MLCSICGKQVSCRYSVCPYCNREENFIKEREKYAKRGGWVGAVLAMTINAASCPLNLLLTVVLWVVVGTITGSIFAGKPSSEDHSLNFLNGIEAGH